MQFQVISYIYVIFLKRSNIRLNVNA